MIWFSNSRVKGNFTFIEISLSIEDKYVCLTILNETIGWAW